MCTEGCLCCVCVRTQNIGVMERCGKFSRLTGPGFHCVAWPCETLVGKVSLRVQQLDVNCETKTKDNVFVNVVISVQYEAIAKAAYDAYYRLANPELQIQAYVFDVVRSTLPRMDLDESFSSKEDLATAVKTHLDETMSTYGYHICKALVTDISPDQRVKMSMNEINASRRLREASKEKAEADKIVQVKAAEADAESKYLSGVGVARQRQAIVGGLRDSILEFSGEIRGTTPKDVMDLLLVTQYFDMLKEVGATNSNTLFIPHAPQAVADLQAALKTNILTNVDAA
ncbi:hypothetical protein CTAYLR_000142 [Chrysophaeum taylorii]|uniref:Band 7 domain-containing protein n=1 Tax=Chrysophaeum taylorii TaxID=2483200 RepID=A0AAD7UHF3_9STRA|nr:hypothetical protein CTAYLR_000142 [Chrysophaeum taylorii]